jgi:cytochrome c oxidase cbb3-type subunit III
MIRRGRLRAGAAVLLGLAMGPAIASAQGRADAAADIEAGRQLFNGMCVECHGAGGAGGDAPSLNRARLVHAPTDAALVDVLANGIPNTAMPRIRRFSDTEMRQIVAYVRSLGRVADVRVPGDANKGGEIYRNLGCAGCHIVNGAGGDLGPDLSDIGYMRSAASLRQSVLDPGAALPKGTLQVPARGYAEYLPLRIVTKKGDEVRGIRVNEDAFTVQVRDQAGKFYSLRKSDLELFEKQIGKSLMPGFASRLTEPEITDLVAYLASLRSAQRRRRSFPRCCSPPSAPQARRSRRSRTAASSTPAASPRTGSPTAAPTGRSATRRSIRSPRGTSRSSGRSGSTRSGRPACSRRRPSSSTA